MGFPNVAQIFNSVMGNSQPAPQSQQTQQSTQVTPGNIPADGNVSNVAPAGKDAAPVTDGTSADSGVEKNPLDAFSDLWKNDTTDDASKSNGDVFTVDPKKLMDAAGQVDFTKIIDATTLATMAKGGEEGIQAMMQAMGKMSQAVYGQSALAATQMINAAVKKSREGFMSEIPGKIRQQNISNHLASENPAFQHDAVKPLVAVLETQFASKYPNATPQEITSHAKEYLSSAFGAFTAPAAESSDSGKGKNPMARKDTDWGSFLE